jgi:hypothetical protein
MESDTRTDPDQQLEQTGDELEERLDRLDGELGDAREEAKAHASHARGDDENDDDNGDGSDPDPGEFDDPDADEEEDDDE